GRTSRFPTSPGRSDFDAPTPGLCYELGARVFTDDARPAGAQVDLALEMLGLDARTAGGQIDQTLQIAGFDASTAGFHRGPPMEVVRLHSAAAGAHANLAAGALNRDWSRAILQLDIATGWHGDLIIDSSQTKLEEAPDHAA